MSHPIFRVLHRIENFRALWVGVGSQLYGCRGKTLLVTEDWGRSFTKVGELPGSGLDWAYVNRLSRRLLRLGVHYMVITRKGTIVLVGRKLIYRLVRGGCVETVFHIPRGSRPLNLAVDNDDNLFFGEYFDNAHRDPVNIYGSTDDGRSWHVVHTFEAGAVRHIHGIQYDSYRDGLWVMTGDEDHESFVAFTDDGFRSLDVVSRGDQQSRVVSGIPTASGFLAGTDTPLEINHILHFDLEEKTRRCLTSVQSSVFYSCRFRQGHVFATVAEPSASNETEYVYLWFSENTVDWYVVAEFEKDIWAMRYFQYGLVFFPAGRVDSKYLVVSPQGVREHDGACLIGDVV